MAFGLLFSLVLALLGLVSVFIYIPYASEFAFWLAITAYFVLLGSRR
jgi:hypothetical protein